MGIVIATLTLTLTSVATIATPADAASGCASWGCATNVNFTSGSWTGTVDDTLTDGYCVDLWVINNNGTKIKRIARSCGAPVGGSAYVGGPEDSYGVRMFRDNGNYKTIVWP